MGALCAATGSFACGVWLETTEHAAQLRDQAEMHAASLKESQRQTLAAQAELADESLPIAGGACASPRPQMCTRDFRPACGLRRDGTRKTYDNACSACADADVDSQAAGACP